MFRGTQDTLSITKTHIHVSTYQTSVCTLSNHLPFKRTVALACKKTISFLPATFEENLKRKSLSLFCCYVVCLKHLGPHMEFGGRNPLAYTLLKIS